MKAFTSAIAAVLLAMTSAGVAFADATEGQGYFSVMGSYVDDAKRRAVDDGINGGQFGFGWGLNQNWNVEVLYMAGRGNGSPDISLSGFGIDV